MKQLLDIARTLSNTKNVEGLARPLLSLLQEITGLESTYLTLVDPATNTQRVLYSLNEGDLEIPENLSVPWEKTLCRQALERDEPVLTQVGKRFPDLEAVAHLGIETYVSVPVTVENEDIYGTLCAASTRAQTITEDDQAVLTLFATLIGRQIQREQHLREAHDQTAGLQRQVAEIQTVSQIGQVCWAADSLRPALETSAELLSHYGNWCQGVAYHAGSAASDAALTSLDVAQLLIAIPQWEMGSGDEQWHHVAVLKRSELPEALQDVLTRVEQQPSESLAVIRVENDLGLAGLILLLSQVPLAKKEDAADTQVVGEASGQYLSLLASRLHQQDRLQLANEELAVQARRDPLTGMYNRRVLMEDLDRLLSQSVRDKSTFAVAFIDLDGFKAMNDHYGHKAGDRFLQMIADRLIKLSRDSDLAARIGGDEFVMLMPVNVGQDEQAIIESEAAIRRRLEKVLSGEYDMAEFGRLDYGGPSIGLIHNTADDVDAEALLMRADAAMYEEKRRRKAARSA